MTNGEDDNPIASAPDSPSAPHPRKRRGGALTPAGRQITGGNAMKDGLRAKSDRFLTWEDPAEHRRLHLAVARFISPRGRVEAEIAVNIAQALWRARRIHAAEAALFRSAADDARGRRAGYEALSRAMGEIQRLGSSSMPSKEEATTQAAVPQEYHEADDFAALRGTTLEQLRANEAHIQRSLLRWIEALEALRGLKNGEKK